MKASLIQINKLLDDDQDDCFCRDFSTQIALSRQKSKTEYARRPTFTAEDLSKGS